MVGRGWQRAFGPGSPRRWWGLRPGLRSGASTSQRIGLQSLALTPHGRWVITGSSDGLLRVWKLSSLKLVGGPVPTYSDAVMSLAVTPDGSQVIATGHGMFGIWDLPGLAPASDPIRVHAALDFHQGIPLSTKAAVTPDGTRVVLGGGDGWLHIFDPVSGVFVGRPVRAHEQVFSLAVTPDGTKIVTSGHEHGQYGVLRVWDLATGAPVGDPVVVSDLTTIAVVPGSTRIILCSGWGPVQIWDLNDDGLSLVHSAQLGRALARMAPTPDGSRVVAGAGYSGIVHVLGLADLAHKAEIKTGCGPIGGLAVTPDGSRLIAGGLLTGTLQVWDMPASAA